MARVLISIYSRPGDTVLDPFSGSGVVPLEAVLLDRFALANDLSPYAYVLTRGKLEAPATLRTAISQAQDLIRNVEEEAPSIELSSVPEWIREFFHPKTLKEVVAAFSILKTSKKYFLTACLLGILHHVRPGFLSFPASHLVPYLRKKKFPPAQYPEMYAYRDLRSRLIAKVRRAYRNAELPRTWSERRFRVWQANCMDLPIDSNSVDAIVSSPPYFGALDYARDNRLRLWFLGCKDWRDLDKSLTASENVYLPQMSTCLREMNRVLKPGSACVLVLGDIERDGKNHRTAEVLSDLAAFETNGDLQMETIFDDSIPDERRSRRRTKTTKHERILVLRKK